MKKKKFDTISVIKKLEKGQTVKDIEKEMREYDKEKAKEPGKVFGVCESCEMETVLVEEAGLCGPCCFGEADTLNGNW